MKKKTLQRSTQTLQIFSNLYRTLQKRNIQNSTTFINSTKKTTKNQTMENKILHSSTTLYKVLQHFYTTLTKFYKTLNNFMIFLKLYKNLQSFYKTLLNSTRNYTQLDQTIQTIQNQPYTTIQNSSGFYKALHNFTKLCDTLQSHLK